MLCGTLAPCRLRRSNPALLGKAFIKWQLPSRRWFAQIRKVHSPGKGVEGFRIRQIPDFLVVSQFGSPHCYSGLRFDVRQKIGRAPCGAFADAIRGDIERILRMAGLLVAGRCGEGTTSAGFRARPDREEAGWDCAGSSRQGSAVSSVSGRPVRGKATSQE